MQHFFVAVVTVAVGAILWSASPIVTLALLVWLLSLAGGYVIGEPKGHGAAGILLGALLGPLGLLIGALLHPTRAIRVAASWYDH